MKPLVISRRSSSADLPGVVAETEGDVRAKVITPQRPLPRSPRQALWTSSANRSSVENSADTVTTERLGTISRRSRAFTEEPSEAQKKYVKVTPKEFGAKWLDPHVVAPVAPNFNATERLGVTISRTPQSGGLPVEYPQRSRNDSVFEAPVFEVPLSTPHQVEWSEFNNAAEFSEAHSDSVFCATTGVQPMFQAFPEPSSPKMVVSSDKSGASEFSERQSPSSILERQRSQISNIATQHDASAGVPRSQDPSSPRKVVTSDKFDNAASKAPASPRSRTSNFAAQHTKTNMSDLL